MPRLLAAFILGLNLQLSGFAYAATGFDINDLSVLFPLDGSKKPLPRLFLDDERLMPEGIFTQVLQRAAQLSLKDPQGVSFSKTSDWAIVGFRFDPCAPLEASSLDAGCGRELRLIAQPLGIFSPADSTLHIVYKLGEGLPKPDDRLLRDLLALKSTVGTMMNGRTDGLPLGVHPLLATAVKLKRQDVPGLFSSFLFKHAKADQLSKVTMMGLRNGAPTDWIFFGGDVVEGRWVQSSVPNVEANEYLSVELNVNGGTASLLPLPQDPGLSTAAFFNATPASLQQDLDSIGRAIHTLENPALSNRNTTDCVSCHSATTARLTPNAGLADPIDGLTANLPLGITAFPAPQSLPSHPLHWNLRAFGYFGLVPTVNMRMVHEAAAAAETVNTIMNLDPPGPDCSRVEEEVTRCFVKSSIQFEAVTPTEVCLAKCIPVGGGRIRQPSPRIIKAAAARVRLPIDRPETAVRERPRTP